MNRGLNSASAAGTPPPPPPPPPSALTGLASALLAVDLARAAVACTIRQRRDKVRVCIVLSGDVAVQPGSSQICTTKRKGRDAKCFSRRRYEQHNFNEILQTAHGRPIRTNHRPLTMAARRTQPQLPQDRCRAARALQPWIATAASCPLAHALLLVFLQLVPRWDVPCATVDVGRTRLQCPGARSGVDAQAGTLLRPQNGTSSWAWRCRGAQTGAHAQDRMLCVQHPACTCPVPPLRACARTSPCAHGS